MITDILIATPGDAPAILSGQTGAWPRLEFRSLDNMALAGLWAALGAQGEASAFEGTAHLLLNTDARWIFEFPDDFARRLSLLQPNEVKDVAARWATHEELVHMGASGPVVEPIVAAVSDQARAALGQGKGLLLLMSL